MGLVNGVCFVLCCFVLFGVEVIVVVVVVVWKYRSETFETWRMRIFDSWAVKMGFRR